MVTLAWAVIGTAVVALIVKSFMSLRPTIEAEHDGLDLSDHGEEGYIYEPKA